LYRNICAAVLIWVVAALQLPPALAQTADPRVILPEVSSALGQPLQARLGLDSEVANIGAGMFVRMADAAEFQRLGIRRYQVVDRIVVTLGTDALRGQVLQLTTSEPLYEPSLRVVISLSGDDGARLLPLELLLPSPDVLGVDRRTVLVYPDDTLWRIANRTRDAAITNNQQMLAVQRLNPAAFVRNNINGLKEWSMLSLPSFAEAIQVPAMEAAETVSVQHTLWQGGQWNSAASDAQLSQSGGQVRITAVQNPDNPERDDASSVQISDAPPLSALAGNPDDAAEYREPVYEERDDYSIEVSDSRVGASGLGPGEGELALIQDDAGSVDAGLDPEVDDAFSPDPLVSSPTASSAQSAASDDPYDLDRLETQIRKEQGSAADNVIYFLFSPQGIGLLAALTFVVLLVLLLMRRRAAEQERELDHAFRDEDPLLAGRSEMADDLSEDGPNAEESSLEDVYTTRLKLAEAYLEMGDTDGAAEMLEEVMADGSSEQQEVARRIMERVDNGDE
jgi:FimV-like protein